MGFNHSSEILDKTLKNFVIVFFNLPNFQCNTKITWHLVVCVICDKKEQQHTKNESNNILLFTNRT